MALDFPSSKKKFFKAFRRDHETNTWKFDGIRELDATQQDPRNNKTYQYERYTPEDYIIDFIRNKGNSVNLYHLEAKYFNDDTEKLAAIQALIERGIIMKVAGAISQTYRLTDGYPVNTTAQGGAGGHTVVITQNSGNVSIGSSGNQSSLNDSANITHPATKSKIDWPKLLGVIGGILAIIAAVLKFFGII
jgi:hypothetical protein